MSKLSKGLTPEQLAKYTNESPKPNEEANKKEHDEHDEHEEHDCSKHPHGAHPATPHELTSEEEQINNEIIQFVKYLAKSDFKTKEAACHGKRITYFRGSDFYSFVKGKAEEISKLLPKFLGDIKLSDENGPEKLLQSLINHEVMLTMERSKEEEKKYKYPKFLDWSKSRVASDKGFYYCAVNIESKTRGILMYLILLGVVAICLFQVWPMQLKIATFYVSVVCLYAIIGLILVRYIFYFSIRILGLEFWIFPNLFEDVSVIDSFKPVLSVSRAKDGTLLYFIRAVGAVTLAYMVYTVYHHPELLRGYTDAGIESFDDIIEWGKEKLDPNQTVVSIRGSNRIKNLETILNETEDLGEDEHDSSHSRKSDSKDEDDSSLKTKKDLQHDNDEADKEADEYGDVELNRDQA